MTLQASSKTGHLRSKLLARTWKSPNILYIEYDVPKPHVKFCAQRNSFVIFTDTTSSKMDNNFDHVLRDQISWTLGFLILATAKVSLKFQVNWTMFDHAIGRTARNQQRGYTQIFSKLTGELPFPVKVFTLIFPEILGDLPFPARGYTHISP